MSNVVMEVSVPKEFNDFLQGVQGLVSAVIAAKQSGADIASIAAAEITVLIPVAAELPTALSQVGTDPWDCAAAAAVQAISIAKLLLGK